MIPTTARAAADVLQGGASPCPTSPAAFVRVSPSDGAQSPGWYCKSRWRISAAHTASALAREAAQGGLLRAIGPRGAS